MSWRRGLAHSALACALSCAPSHESPAPSAQRAHLAAGVAARVGNDEISLGTVSRIAQAQHLPASAARDRAVSDALFAAGARVAFEGGSLVPTLERAALARQLLQRFKDEATARGPATDREVAEISALHWQEYDRPETARTTHAVARVREPAQDSEARAVAQAIFRALHGVTDPAEFIRLAQAVPHGSVEVRAERLPALTPDGRSYYPENAPPNSEADRFDKDFSAAANALAVGQISEPTKTSFGYHVILCEARLPARRPALEERRRLLTPEAILRRAASSKQELLAREDPLARIERVRAVEDLTTQVQVAAQVTE